MIGLGSTRTDNTELPPAKEVAQVLTALRQRRLHHLRSRIPVYLVIGPAGMGKSSLIRRSGLECDLAVEFASSSWWLGESAFFVEVADRGNWDGDHPVFASLRRLRSTMPVSGLVMVVSPADLTLADVGERADMGAAQIRFLRDFEQHFGYAPPVYLVVAKLDLTPGFAEFFDHLEPAEREQAWGFTFPLPSEHIKSGVERVDVGAARSRSPVPGRPFPARAEESAALLREKTGDGTHHGNIAAAYRDNFRRLLDAVRARVTQWISQETNVAHCERIVGFGAQVAALETILRPVVEPLMPSDKRRWQGAFLRGVYLTSTQQDALSLDTLLPELARRFALQRIGTLPPDLGRDDETLGYFVEGLFRRVLLPEAGLVQRPNARTRARTRRGWLCAGVVVAVCAILGVLSALSYRDGITRIAALDAAAAKIGPGLQRDDANALPTVLPTLDALAALRGERASSPTFVIPLDIYANALIATAGGMLYDRAVTKRFGPLLNRQLARNLVEIDASSDALRDALAASERKNDPGAVRRWLRTDEPSNVAPAETASLSRHAEAAVRLGAVPQVEPAYSAFARQLLSLRDGPR